MRAESVYDAAVLYSDRVALRDALIACAPFVGALAQFIGPAHPGGSLATEAYNRAIAVLEQTYEDP